MTEEPEIGLDMPTLVKAYTGLRASIAEQEEALKERLAPLKENLETVSNALLDECNRLGADSIKTPVGTVSRRVTERFWASDWEAMHEFIVQNNAPYLLEKRVNNGAMRQFLEDHPNKHPVGLNTDRKYTIQVRKPSNK